MRGYKQSGNQFVHIFSLSQKKSCCNQLAYISLASFPVLMMVLFASLILLSFARYSAFPITAEVQTVLMIKSFTNMVGKDLIEEYFVGDGDGDVTRSLYEDTRVCLLSVSKTLFFKW